MPEEREKKRPRPLELNHSNLSESANDKTDSSNNNTKDMADIAIKCVSPGLPPLSAKMKTTVLLSRNIEAQQRHIIAQRIASAGGNVVVDDDDDSNNDKNNDNNNNNNNNNKTPSTSGLTDNMDQLSIPSAGSNKRFKRDKVPTPLNLNLASNAQRPIIKSAPIYNVQPVSANYYTPSTARRPHFKMAKQRMPTTAGISRQQQQQQQQLQRPTMTPITPHDAALLRRQMVVPTSAYPYPYPPTAGRNTPATRRMPKTATTLRNPSSLLRAGPPLTHQQLARYQQQLAYQQHQWAKFKQYQESQKVSHVTDVFEGEGTRFAPLEAQPLSAQRKFFNLDPIKPQTVTTNANHSAKTNDRITEESEEEDEDDPESAAIEEDAKVGMGQEDQKPSLDVELRLENNVFKFQLTREGENDKQRFLNHCATAWEQFYKLD